MNHHMPTGIHDHAMHRRTHARTATALFAALALSACAVDEADQRGAETSDSEAQSIESAGADVAITASYGCTTWDDIDAGGRSVFSICTTMPSGYRHAPWSDCTSGARVDGPLRGNNQTSKVSCPAGSRPTNYSYRLLGPPAPEPCRPGKPC
jgi:hypothetical protein